MGVLSINTQAHMYRYLSKSVNYYHKVVKPSLLKPTYSRISSLLIWKLVYYTIWDDTRASDVSRIAA